MIDTKPSGAPVRHVYARRADLLECVASVLLAILIAHTIGATNISWAAFAGYMVMRGHIADTLTRGTLRIVGTTAGGLLALTTTPWLVPHWPLLAIAIMLVGTVSIYAAIIAKRAYAWLFLGLTFAMVVFDKVEHPDIALKAFVITRILETLAGTLACVVVNITSGLTWRRYWPAERLHVIGGARWHPEALRHATQGGLALTALSALSAGFQVPALAQSAVTIMAVMLVPATGIGPSGLLPVSMRVLQRFVGCITGALFAAGFLFVAQGSPWLLIVGTIIGVAIGRHLETGPHGYPYFGMQFTLAILIALVPDTYANAAIGPALERLSGILIGVVVLEPILIGWHVFSPPRAHTHAQPSSDESTEI